MDASGKDDAYHPDTKLVRGGQKRSSHRETSEAIYLTSGYVYESAEQAEAAFKGEEDCYIYSRYGNPTVSIFEERLQLLEGAEACRATASGMSAMFASLACFLKTGDRIVASRALFGSCYTVLAEILPRYGITTTFVDGHDLNAWQDALKGGAQAVFLETPSNPMLDLIDIASVSELAHKAGALVVVDNVFSTPLLQRPLALGADVVTYSATKHIDGQGRCMGGAVLGSRDYIDNKFTTFYRNTGPCMSPFNAWTLLKGLETLAVRVERQCKTTHDIALWLQSLDTVTKVSHPGLPSHRQHELAKRQMSGFSTLVAFELSRGKDQAFEFLNRLKLIDISNNLGDCKTLITHPFTTTHSKMPVGEKERLGITPGTVRLSVGLEDLRDLIGDMAQAMGPG